MQLQLYADSHNSIPNYLGVTLDTTLSFKQHLLNAAPRLRTRNKVIHKLWGSNAPTLLCSALGHVYSASE